MTLRPTIRRVAAASVLAALLTSSCAETPPPVHPVDFAGEELHEQLEPLGRSIGTSRIVLLGENGHGVGDLTRAKVELVRWLYEEHGFDVIAFESGYFECGYADLQAASVEPREALLNCLRYPFQHRQLLPLFELIRDSRDTARPLRIAGVDIQGQGFDSGGRPDATREFLDDVDSDFAARIARLDTALFLVADSGGLGDGVFEWAAEHGAEAKAAYDSAAVLTGGWERWVFRLATDWVDRLAVRGLAERDDPDASRPPAYYGARDVGMARAVTAIADSIAGQRKVVVWVHNDHARYGDVIEGDPGIRAAGGLLGDVYGSDVYSIGVFMGRGSVADNSREQKEMAAIDPVGVEAFLRLPGAPASYTVLRGAVDDSVAAWAGEERPYLRMGLFPNSLVPAEEFDALIYADSVGPPNYDLRP